MSVFSALQQRDCPVCAAPSSRAKLFMRQSIDEGRITAASFASRKVPEFMSYRLVRCEDCTAVFASEAPAKAALSNAYAEADYSTAREAAFAATTYEAVLAPFLDALSSWRVALEIGTGTGVFLKHLHRLGFRDIIGLEPSRAAIAAATDDVRPWIREGIFTSDASPARSVSLICCFQTLEHVPDPRGLVDAAFTMLEPGGILALITHDYTAPVNRLLGRRSPIIDIEHLQLFNPASLRFLVSASGFEVNAVVPIRNVYPLGYWLSLLPLPLGIKRAALAMARVVGLDQRRIGLNVGNLLTIARKPNTVG